VRWCGPGGEKWLVAGAGSVRRHYGRKRSGIREPDIYCLFAGDAQASAAAASAEYTRHVIRGTHAQSRLSNMPARCRVPLFQVRFSSMSRPVRVCPVNREGGGVGRVF